MKVKRIPHFIDPSSDSTGRSKNFNLDPAIIPTYKKLVSGDIVSAVRKRKQKIMEKLKQQEVIDYNPEESVEESSEY